MQVGHEGKERRFLELTKQGMIATRYGVLYESPRALYLDDKVFDPDKMLLKFDDPASSMWWVGAAAR